MYGGFSIIPIFFSICIIIGYIKLKAARFEIIYKIKLIDQLPLNYFYAKL